MAQPKSFAGRSRPHVIPLTLDDEELDFIDFTAKDHGMARTTYLRTLVRKAMREERELRRNR